MGFTIGAALSQLIYGIDILSDPSLLSNIESNPTMIKSMKLLQVSISLCGMVLPAWFFPKALEQNSATFLKTNTKTSSLNFFFAIAIILISIPFVSWLIEMNARLQLPASLAALEAKLKASEEAAAELTKAFIASTTTSELLLNLVVVAIIPAIAEEFLFRGALQQFFMHCFKNIHFAVIISAAIFSAFHGQVYGFMPRWVLGILLGYLFAYSGSVWPGVLAHFANNALTLSVTHFKLDQSDLAILKEDYHFPLYAVVLSAIFCLVILYLLKRNQPLNNANQLD
jgi:membrane protease YdiL (CAAX protease family)